MFYSETRTCGIKLKGLLLFALIYLPLSNANENTDEQEQKQWIEEETKKINNTELGPREYVYLSAVDFANWIDSFFGESERLEDAEFNYLRLRNDLIFRKGESPRYRPKIKAKVHLPQMNEKFSLIFSNEKNDEEGELENGEEVESITNERNNTSAAINYESEQYNRSKFDSRIGLGSGLKLFAFTRHSFLAYKSEALTIKNYNYLIWKEDDGLGFATKINLNKVLSANQLFRWDYAFLRAEKTRGNEWSTGFSIVDHLSDEKWIAYQLSANGESELGWDVTEYKVSTRYRMKTEIDWLFFEVEPAFSYVKTIERPSRHFVPSIKFRFEIRLER